MKNLPSASITLLNFKVLIKNVLNAVGWLVGELHSERLRNVGSL